MLLYYQWSILNNIFFQKIELMQSKVEIFQGLIQVDFQGGDRFSLM